MYRLKEKLEGYYAVIAKMPAHLYVYHEHTVIEINKADLSRRVLVSGVNDYYIKTLSLNGGILYNYNEMLVYEKEGVSTQIGREWYPEWVDGNEIIVTNRNRNPYTLARITLDGNILWEKEVSLSNQQLVHDGNLYFNNIDDNGIWYHLLNRLSLKTGDFKELINFNEHYKAPKSIKYYFIAFYQDTLVCLLNNGTVAGIDPENGAVKWEVKEWHDQDGNKQDGFIAAPWQGGRSGNKIYILQGTYFACFDLQSNRLTLLKEISHDLNGDPLFIQRSALYENKLYYVADNRGKNWNRFGVFDTHKEQITWQTEIALPKGEILNNAPIASDKYIFLNDGAWNLYIFEKI